ncbi:hypothetical protein, partial [Paenibacillus sp. 598K]|uniref:hypothetical protein n=1 Tax=Paenibacillus sp. 598K TaxID=1117987 RepID=UPI001625DCF8
MLTAILVCALLATGTSVYMARANGASWTTVADTSWYNPIYPSYQIDSEEKLAGIAKLVNEDPTVDGFRGKRLEITKDLNLQNNGTHSNLIWEPIGTEAQPFRGSLTAYDGQTFSISGMTLPDNVPYAGLVGYMEAGTVGGFKFEATGSINVTNNNQPIYVGSAVGKMTGHSIVYNITNHIAISATSTQDVYAGGIVGSGEGDISTSINYGSVTAQGANTHAGGMTGHIGSYGMKMKKNANHAAITTTANSASDAYAAGIAGYAQGALRMEEENTPFDNSGAILVQAGGNNYAGGLVGRIDGELNVSELTSVTAQVEVNAPGSTSSYVGGLVGAITAQQQDRSYRVNFLHTAPVVNNGGSQVYTGGIAGY